MAGKYFVDWSASADVVVRHIAAWDFDSTPPEGMTLAAAKAEVIEHYQRHIDYARALIRRTRQVRASDFTNH